MSMGTVQQDKSIQCCNFAGAARVLSPALTTGPTRHLFAVVLSPTEDKKKAIDEVGFWGNMRMAAGVSSGC